MSDRRTILILSANPKGTNPLRLDEEVQKIKERLRLSKYRDLYQIETAGAVRVRDIRQAMFDYDPKIVHFSGHGAGAEGLVFEDETGQVKLVSTEALAGLFALFADKLDCVLLNACYSEVQAEEISQQINYVIGMSQKIGDRAAIEFAVGFYMALGAGETFESCYKHGCNEINMQGIPEYLTPKLLTKVSEFPPPSTITTNPLLNNGRTVLSFSQVPPNDNIKSQYSQLLREEFDLLIARLKKPEKNSRTSPLLYGKDFPFGTNQVIPEISRYTLFQDILKLHAASVSLHRTQRLKEEADPKVHMLSKVASCRWLIFVSAIADGLHEFDEEILLNPISDAFKNTSINNDISTRLSDKSREYMRSGKTINTDFATTKQLLSLLAKTAFNAGLTLENLLKEEQKAHRRSLGNFQSSLKNKKQVNNEKQYKIKILFSDTEGSYDKILQALKLRNIELISSTSCTLISGEVALSELVIKYTGDIAIEKKLEDFPDSDRLNGVKVFHASVDKKKKINDEKRYKINIFFSDNAGSYNKLLHFLADKQINLISSQSWTLVHGEVAKSELIISYDGDLEKLKAALEKIYSCDELCNIVCQFTVSIIDWEITN